jgi:hypothetical protein
MMAGGGHIPRYNGEFGSYVDGIDPMTGTFYMPESPPPQPDQASMRKVASSPYVTGPRNAEEAALLQKYPAPSKASKVPAEMPELASGTGGAPAAPGMDIQGMYRKAMDATQGQAHPYAKDIEALGQERVKAAQEDVTGLEAIHKRFDDSFKGRRDRLESRDAELGKLKQESLGLAWISAGAAIAKTPGRGLSGVLSGLTAGIDTGSKEYAKGMDKYRAAQEKLNDAKDRLEEVEAGRAEMSARELHKARSGVRTTMIGARADLISANMEMFKLNEAKGTKLFEAQMQMGLEQLRQSGANARAAMPSGPERTAMMLGKGNTPAARLESGMKKLQEIQAGKFDVRTLYAEHIKDAAKTGMPVEPLATYAGRFGAVLPR